jgi:hypothetical protein
LFHRPGPGQARISLNFRGLPRFKQG